MKAWEHQMTKGVKAFDDWMVCEQAVVSNCYVEKRRWASCLWEAPITQWHSRMIIKYGIVTLVSWYLADMILLLRSSVSSWKVRRGCITYLLSAHFGIRASPLIMIKWACWCWHWSQNLCLAIFLCSDNNSDWLLICTCEFTAYHDVNYEKDSVFCNNFGDSIDKELMH